MPGWYRDPWGGAALRWWDGEAWTAGVSHTGLDAPPEVARVEDDPSFDRRSIKVAIAAYLLAGVAAAILGLAVAAVTESDVVFIVTAQSGLYGTMLVACRYASRTHGTGSWRTDFGLRFRAPDFVTGIGVFVAATVVANAIASVVAADADLQGSSTDSLFDTGPSLTLRVIVVLTAVIAAPYVEEVFFRGLLLRSLASRLRPIAANIVQAVLFAIAHVDPTAGWHNVDTVVRIFVLGMAFGYIAQEKRRLGPGIAAHFVTNTVAVVVNLVLVG